MLYCIHIQIFAILKIISTILSYRISASRHAFNVNKLESQDQVNKIKELVGNKWLSLKSNIKINLHLQIFGVSLGQGNSSYINLLNIMQALDYGDDISIAKATIRVRKELSKRFKPTSTGDYLLYTDETKIEQLEDSKPLDIFPAGDDNLVAKAFNLVRERANICRNINFIAIVRKNICSGTGLGGGSSDAAVAIKLATKLTKCELDELDIARKIGSDVPFLLSSLDGLSSCIAVGRGDTFSPVKIEGLPTHVYLFFPNTFVKTAKVYDRIKKFALRGSKLSEEQVRSASELALSNIANLEFRNDLLPTTCHFSKKLVQLVNILESQDVFNWSMSGSGSACFGFVRKDVPDNRVSNEISRISLEYGEPLGIVKAQLLPQSTIF